MYSISFHLLKAKLHAASADSDANTDDSVDAVTLDCRNAFNYLTRAHLVNFLDEGCATHTSLPHDDEHDMTSHKNVPSSIITVVGRLPQSTANRGCNKETL
jgi:hypothetical protein